MRTTAAVCFLLVSCFSSLTRGNHDPDPTMVSPSLSENSTAPIHNSTADINSLTNSTDPQLNTSSEVDHSTATELLANSTSAQGGNGTTGGTFTESTAAPGKIFQQDPTTATSGTTVDTTTVNGTRVPGNITESQGGSDLSVDYNNTSLTMTNVPTTATTLLTTEVPKTHSSTPVQAKARVDTSELNVGDNDTKASMDPLLAGLVSVFVVTAVIISLLIFLKFRRRNERPEFRRLQDLPMDDMMEDAPLSMYSY